jgi:hypothetical protein
MRLVADELLEAHGFAATEEKSSAREAECLDG